jgi:multidrug efflux pump subunit AcrB
LLAIVLATGLVVDDAIVVLENIQRRRAQGLGARAAAVLGTRQVFFAVMATTAVLIAVFVPIALLPSTAGRLFREFGLVLAVAVGISSFVALSLVPTLAARLPATDVHGPVYRRITAFGGWLADGYARSLRGILAHPLVTVAVAVVLAGACAGLYQALDQELLPPEDRGVLYVNATGPDGVGLTYTERQADRLEAILQPLVTSGEAEYLYTIVGRYDLNRARVTAPLIPWEERERSQQEIAAALADEFARVPGARVSVSNPNSLNLRDADGGLEVALIGSDYGRLYEVARQMADAMEREIPALSGTRISYQPTQPELSLVIDRRRAADLGVPLDALAATLRAMVDGDEITDLNVDDQAVPIILESSAGTINDPTDLVNLYVQTSAGDLLPLSSVVSIRESGVAAELDRHAQRRAIEIDANVAPGVPLQEAVAEVRALANRMLPAGVDLLLLGEAAELAETSRDVSITYAVALLVVFLVLCAQFESITSAAVVTIIVPFGIAAAILALYLSGISVNIYSQIGLVMLIGLMAKNSILLVEFADQMRDRGQSVAEAIATSARVRLRPVMMTLLSTMLGGLPLILSTGPGAEARSAIGWVIFGGLGLATGFTLFLTPAVYRLLAPLSPPRASEDQRLAGELEQAGADRL